MIQGITGGIRNRYFFVCDLILLPTMIYLSFALRLDLVGLSGYLSTATVLAALTFLLTPLIFTTARLYSRYWPYASVDELMLFFAAVGGLTVAIGAGSAVLNLLDVFTLPAVPRSIPFIFFLLALPCAIGPRLLVRLAATHQPKQNSTPAQERVLIIGAGQAGTMILRELQRNPQLGMMVMGFLDDDRAKQRMRVGGVLVLGTRHDLAAVAHNEEITRVIIAMPTAPGRVIREIIRGCEQVGVRAQTIPGLYNLIDGTVGVQQLRDVEIEDLLRREPIQTDLSAVNKLLCGKRVLITGAGGSIGSELARQVLRCHPRELILLGHGENTIFSIHNELSFLLQTERQAIAGSARHAHDQTVLHPVIADVRFPARLQSVFEKHRPEIVFHAAAHKHVPLMESNPAEAILNNVIGTRNVLDASERFGVERFVLISTDKAVNPTNVMGASKRVAELLVHQAALSSNKPYMVIRFGNVLGSRGSVIPTMKEQIARGGPVTVTHPEITRFFITIPEAVQLVLQAGVLGRGGEVFVLDMGEPIKIIDLACDLIRLSGLEVGQDIDIEIVGLRPGEKLFEELFIAGEHYKRTSHHKIFTADNASHLIPKILPASIRALEEAARRSDAIAVRAELQRLLPEFTPEVNEPPQRGTKTQLPPRDRPIRVPSLALQFGSGDTIDGTTSVV